MHDAVMVIIIAQPILGPALEATPVYSWGPGDVVKAGRALYEDSVGDAEVLAGPVTVTISVLKVRDGGIFKAAIELYGPSMLCVGKFAL